MTQRTMTQYQSVAYVRISDPEVKCRRLNPDLAHQVPFDTVASDQDPALEPAALQVQILPLSARQVGLFLRLEVLEVLLLLGQPLLLFFLGR